MSLSLMTLMGYQRPTRHEKYIMGECIKIIRYNKYPSDEIEADFEKKHNESLNGIIEDLKKVLARPIREDRAMAVCVPEKSAGPCRCVDIPMPKHKEVMKTKKTKIRSKQCLDPKTLMSCDHLWIGTIFGIKLVPYFCDEKQQKISHPDGKEECKQFKTIDLHNWITNVRKSP